MGTPDDGDADAHGFRAEGQLTATTCAPNEVTKPTKPRTKAMTRGESRGRGGVDRPRDCGPGSILSARAHARDIREGAARGPVDA